MMDETQALAILNENYAFSFEKLEFLRDSGCLAYAAYAEGIKYFLRITKPLFFETSAKSLDIHMFLLEHDFPVPKIMRTKDGFPYVQVRGKRRKLFFSRV